MSFVNFVIFVIFVPGRVPVQIVESLDA